MPAFDNSHENHHEADDAVQSPRNDRPRIVGSNELLQGQNELWIEHQGEMYRLRVTSRGKLLLTK